jgi:hypothetical protein
MNQTQKGEMTYIKSKSFHHSLILLVERLTSLIPVGDRSKHGNQLFLSEIILFFLFVEFGLTPLIPDGDRSKHGNQLFLLEIILVFLFVEFGLTSLIPDGDRSKHGNQLFLSEIILVFLFAEFGLTSLIPVEGTVRSIETNYFFQK